MYRRYKNWIRLIKFIRKHRKMHRARFEILTTSTEVIIIEAEKREQLRINENLQYKIYGLFGIENHLPNKLYLDWVSGLKNQSKRPI